MNSPGTQISPFQPNWTGNRKGLPGPLKGGVILVPCGPFQFHVLPRNAANYRNASNSFDIISTCLRTSHSKARDGSS